MDREKINALRMQRQFLSRPADEEEYEALFRDLQPGQNVYWNGFGEPPVLSFRAEFDDVEFNRRRQARRELVKGRFAGGNLGWIMPEDWALYGALYRKPLPDPNERQAAMLELIRQQGPINIQGIKEMTGLLVKEITPLLHRLQEACLIYEDQFDGQWDRGWYLFEEMFPQVDFEQFTREEAMQEVLRRFARRMVWFDIPMARGFFKLKLKELQAGAQALCQAGELAPLEGGYISPKDLAILEDFRTEPMRFIYAIHRNDVLYKVWEPELKEWAKTLTSGLEYDCEPLQYLLIDGEFHGVVVGHFRNGPYDLNDVRCDLPDPEVRREEILAAVSQANFGRLPVRFMGRSITIDDTPTSAQH